MLSHTPIMPFSPFKGYQSCQKLSRSIIARGLVDEIDYL
jgi:hypothetical protein